MEADNIRLTSKGKQKIIKDGYGYVKENAAPGTWCTGGVSVKMNSDAKAG